MRPNRIQLTAIVLGLLGVVGCVVGAIFDPAAFFRAWLCSYLFWLGVPLAGGHDAAPPPRIVTLSVLSTGELFLDGNAVNRAQLNATLDAWASAPQQPVLAVRADRDTSYDKVADVLATAQRSGLAGVKVEGIGGE